MTITCLSLEKALPLTKEEVEKYNNKELLKSFALNIAKAQTFSKENTGEINDLVIQAILHYPEEFSIGRCGLRTISSTWAKEKYPNAAYELVFTLVSIDNQEVHVLIMYLP